MTHITTSSGEPITTSTGRLMTTSGPVRGGLALRVMPADDGHETSSAPAWTKRSARPISSIIDEAIWRYPKQLTPQAVERTRQIVAAVPCPTTYGRTGRPRVRRHDLAVLCAILTDSARITDQQIVSLTGYSPRWVRDAIRSGRRLLGLIEARAMGDTSQAVNGRADRPGSGLDPDKRADADIVRVSKRAGLF